MHFPFVTFGVGPRVKIDETADGFSQDFEGIREREGWHSSSFDYDTVKVYLAGEDKVHLSVGFNRFKENGEKYATGTVFYVATKIDGRWGVQLRTGIGARFWKAPALWITTKVNGEWDIQLRSLMPATYPFD